MASQKQILVRANGLLCQPQSRLEAHFSALPASVSPRLRVTELNEAVVPWIVSSNFLYVCAQVKRQRGCSVTRQNKDSAHTPRTPPERQPKDDW